MSTAEENSYIYELAIAQSGSRHESSTQELILASDKRTTIIKDVAGKACEMAFTIADLEYNRKIYQPNEIRAIITLTVAEDMIQPSLAELEGMLLRKAVTLKITVTQTNTGKTGNSTPVSTHLSEAKNYFIYEICPVIKSSSRTQIYIKLSIFSMDKLMTLDKYSQAYLGRKLRAEILASLSRFELKTSVNNDSTHCDVPVRHVEVNDQTYIRTGEPSGKESEEGVITKEEVLKLQHLAWGSCIRTKDRDGKAFVEGDKVVNKKIQNEFIHPYLVQYNESFHEFLVRITNRCGEFLYFEDGMLNVGLKLDPSEEVEFATSDPTVKKKKYIIKTTDASIKGIQTLSGYSEVSFQNITSGALAVNDYARDSIKGAMQSFGDSKTGNHDNIESPVYGRQIYKNTGNVKNVAFPADTNFNDTSNYYYNSETAHDEFFMPLYSEGFGGSSFTELNRGSAGKHIAHAVASVLNSTSLVELLSNAATEYLSLGFLNARYKDVMGKRGKERFIAPYAPTHNTSSETFTDAPDVVVPFSENELHRWTTLEYYSDIKAYEERQQRRMVTIKMDANIRDIKLGEIIKLDVTGDAPYAVCEVNTSIMGTKGSQTIKAIPLYAVRATPDGPGNADGIQGYMAFPPVHPCGAFRKSGPQTAFVTDTADPKRQNRVRIRYPWQTNAETIPSEDIYIPHEGKEVWDAYNKTKTEASTPWIRLTSPSANEGSGIYFEPEPGDEVLVNFENGNIERPYAVGALYSKDSTSPAGKGRRVIVSKFGHMLRFKDPSDGIGEISESTGIARIMGQFSPLWDTLQFWIRDLPEITTDIADKLTGGIDLSDAYGLYNISMSSDERAIKINSPLGNISLNALTGISISAPNGNINIQGKNVNIKASNKVNIESGSNIKDRNNFYLTGDLNSTSLSNALVDKTILSTTASISLRPIDFGLIRTIYEIIMRPIDGTLSLKSHGFLKLEAGEGEAQIPKEKYSESKPASGQAILYKRHQIITRSIEAVNGITGSFMNDVKSVCTSLNGKIRTFNDLYIQRNYLKDINSTDILAGRLYDTPLRKFTINDLSESKRAEFLRQGDNSAEEALYSMNGLFNEMWDLINNDSTGLKSLISSNYIDRQITRYALMETARERLKSDFKNAFTNGIYLLGLCKNLLSSENATSILSPNSEQLSEENFKNNKRLLARHLVNEFFKDFGNLFPDLKLTFNTNVSLAQDGDWEREANAFNIELKKSESVKRFVSQWYSEAKAIAKGYRIWKDGLGVKGKILMSDNARKTWQWDAQGNSIISVDNETGAGGNKSFIREIKAMLLDL